MSVIGHDLAHLAPTSQVQIHLSARGLRRADVLSKSDPLAILIMADGSGRKREIGRTETIKDCHEPVWTTSFMIDYNFEQDQRIEVKIVDEDSVTSNDFLGLASFSLASLLVAPGQKLNCSLTGRSGKREKGVLCVSGEEAAYVHDHLTLDFAGVKLPNKDGLFGKSDPFFVIERVREDGSFVPILKSEVVMNNLSPTWPRIKVSVQQLCNGDHHRPLRIIVYDWDRNEKHDYMGELEICLADLLEKQGTNLALADKQRKKGKAAGHLVAKSVQLFQEPTLLDYIAGGCQINMTIAIDFTGSNGNPRQPGTLHYIDPAGTQLNDYQQAIVALGNILQEYDYDKRFPVFGFGGKLAPGAPAQHCFPIRPPGGGGEVEGVRGILEAYASALQSVGLSGPTLFTEVVREACARARQGCSQQNQQYTVLLILTDGVINDMQSTVDAIVEGSSLPLSIIIVGVGAADFSAMRALDSDDELLRDSSGRACARDIVQFVAFQKFRTEPGHAASLGGSLAKETLAELPTQLLSAMKQLRIHPNPRRSAPPAEVYMNTDLPSQAFQGASAPPESPPSYSDAMGH